ncbi:hypothetical protein DITRI_Ditri01bG0153200 [Diplodiscus trichospermus]
MLDQVSFIFLVLFACYIGVQSQELKHLTNELEEINVSACEIWELYRDIGISLLLQGIEATERFTVIDDITEKDSLWLMMRRGGNGTRLGRRLSNNWLLSSNSSIPYYREIL